mmetsp:Transcript_22809/g.60090  ORF Transcript_22809/g.60090 Transcript_22809/m.60090 type:complete len:99 (+) Transcript_22809:79-375(+)
MLARAPLASVSVSESTPKVPHSCNARSHGGKGIATDIEYGTTNMLKKTMHAKTSLVKLIEKIAPSSNRATLKRLRAHSIATSRLHPLEKVRHLIHSDI